MQVTIEIHDELARQLEPERQHLADIIRRGLRHRSPGGLSIVEEVFDFLSRQPSPGEIIAFNPSEKSVQRLRDLLDKNRERSLTSDEEMELDTLQALNHLFALIKLQARQQLRAPA
ncbi:MAG: hypothetical protein HYY23_16380 [Verrucomicrobia bacterium]|nr:hypothetical protein [Verrucomicrobiota bacterium]